MDASINIHHAEFRFDNQEDYIIVKDYSENEGMLDELIRLNVVHPTIIAYIPSGFIQAPLAKLTDEAIALHDEHFTKLNI